MYPQQGVGEDTNQTMVKQQDLHSQRRRYIVGIRNACSSESDERAQSDMKQQNPAFIPLFPPPFSLFLDPLPVESFGA
jgi:hypothetical protein